MSLHASITGMRRYSFLLPFSLPPLLLLGWALGGAWNWLVVLVVFGLVPLLDMIIGIDAWNPESEQAPGLEKDNYYRAILYAWVPVQFLVLAFSISVAGQASAGEWLALAVSTGVLTGGVGITVAHELGHKLATWEQWLGRVLLISVGYMHFHIEHNKGHHAHVATPEDPATARAGQGLYAFLPQTLVGSFRHAWQLERDRLAKNDKPAWSVDNQVLWGIAGSVFMLLGAARLGGAAGAGLFIVQAVVAVGLLEIVNYIEHYGLERQPRDDSRFYERVTEQHSWNASHWLTNGIIYNLQRHSHHHMEHHRRYQVLKHFDSSPQLPTGYAGMVLLALVPPMWRRVMDPRLASWQRDRQVERNDTDTSSGAV